MVWPDVGAGKTTGLLRPIRLLPLMVTSHNSSSVKDKKNVNWKVSNSYKPTWTVPMELESDGSGSMESSSCSLTESKGLQLAFECQSQTELIELKCVPGPQDWKIGLPFQQLANLVQSPGTGLNPEYPLGQIFLGLVGLLGFLEMSLQQISFLVGQFFNHGVNNPFSILGLINGVVE